MENILTYLIKTEYLKACMIKLSTRREIFAEYPKGINFYEDTISGRVALCAIEYYKADAKLDILSKITRVDMTEEEINDLIDLGNATANPAERDVLENKFFEKIRVFRW